MPKEVIENGIKVTAFCSKCFGECDYQELKGVWLCTKCGHENIEGIDIE